jgi:hypothetical protein
MADRDQIEAAARSHFGAYDVLGYFVPGATLLAAVIALEWMATRALESASGNCLARVCAPVTPFFTTLKAVLALNPGSSWLTDAFVVASVLLAAYVIGHLVASISAAAIDRLYMARGIGYPLPFLLRKANLGPDAKDSSHFHRALMFWVNAYLLVRYLLLPGVLPVHILLPDPFATIGSPISPSTLNIAALVCETMVVAVVLARGFTRLQSREWPRPIMPLAEDNRLLKGVRYFLAGSSLPSRLVTALIRSATGTHREVDEVTAKAFVARLRAQLGLRADQRDDDLYQCSAAYWHAVIALRRSDPTALPPLDNWMRLYSFARNLAAAFCLAFLYGIFWWRAQGDTLFATSETDRAALQVLPLVTFALAFLLLQRYHYLYTDYYTKYLIRSYAFPPGSAEAGSLEVKPSLKMG